MISKRKAEPTKPEAQPAIDQTKADTPESRVRYRPDNAKSNRILKMALIQEWGNECYWCKSPRQYDELAIDHIVAKKLDQTTFEKYIKDGKLPAGFDRNRPCNLAPICTACNADKGNSDVFLTGKMHLRLGTAADYSDAVINRVVRFNPNNKLAEALLAASEADLKESTVKAVFDSLGPLLLPKLAYLERNGDYVEPYKVLVNHELVAYARLDRQGRNARAILDELFGLDVYELIEDAVAALIEDMTRQAVGEFEGNEYPGTGQLMSTDSADLDVMRIDISQIRADLSDSGDLTLTLRGDVDGTLNVPVSVASEFGDTTDFPQADYMLTADFEFEVELLKGDADRETIYWEPIWSNEFTDTALE